MRALYTIIISLYSFSLKLFSLFNQKARDWFYGRRNIFQKLDEVFTAHYADENPRPVIWIHCASLGEYEQGKPVIEEIKKRFPGFVVLLTFFSPSGFNNKAHNSEADYVFYLPIDTRRNARKFIRIVSPSIAVFVKYEFWFNYLNELYVNSIPVYTISAIFRPEQHFFKWYGGWFRTHLRRMNRIFVQDEESAELLSMIDINNAKISGDTRFDRVAGIKSLDISLPLLENFLSGSMVIVAGSTWPPDEEILKDLLNKVPESVKFVIAPHEVNPGHIKDLVTNFNGKSILYSQLAEYLKEGNKQSARVVIIDSIGLLSKIYKYADIAYIGGGFGVGIHNTLEAAVFGVPVLFGPNYHRFREAKELIANNAAISVKNSGELTREVQAFIKSPQRLQSYSTSARLFVNDRTGATRIIIGELEYYIKNVFSR
ncbi:MAG: 3-deoxy-D-manno-octulosonic acid transferase [Chloroflexota bacterium]|nr:glycosyltransferase N-terminal domain-containing protein [Lentimicrobium sp.]